MIESVASCLAVLASLCFNGNAQADVSWSSLWSGARIRYEGTEIVAQAGSDSPFRPFLPQMQSFCWLGACTLFRAHCGDADRQYRCTLYYSFDRQMEVRKVTITGERTAVLAAMSSVQLVRSSRVLIRLSFFSYDAPDDLPPMCRVRTGCPEG
jgi:hypothetical protein